jgi:small-conductance mechanosensitive channel
LGIPFIAEVLLDEWGVVTPELFHSPFLSRAAVGLAGGLLSGLLQMPLLKPFIRNADLWLIASVLGWGCCWSITAVSGLMAALLGIFVRDPILGLITGIFMIQMLKPFRKG